MCAEGWKIAYSASPAGYCQAYMAGFNSLHLCYYQSFSVFETIQCRLKLRITWLIYSKHVLGIIEVKNQSDDVKKIVIPGGFRIKSSIPEIKIGE